MVVFDKVRENTAGILTTQRTTYSDAANTALNQTLVRSINTSLTALLPVASILFVGAGLLGAGTLKDLSLVLFVGMLSGTYSSIFIATPVLADLKEREPQYKDLAKRVALRQSGGRAAKRAAARATDDTVRVPAAGPVAEVNGGASGLAAGAAAGSGPVSDDGAVATDEELVEPGADDEMTVPAAQGAASQPRRVPDATRPTIRQQPRRGGRAQRRPGARKKRR